MLSRCQRFDFHRVSWEAIVGRLETVCAGEGISAEPAALELIAGLSQGGLRDALNMLEYCAGENGTITSESAERLLGASSRTLLASLAGAVAAREVHTALAVIDDVYLSSRDIAVFWRELISFYRDMLVALAVRMEGVRDEAVKNAAEAYTLPRLLYVIEIFISAESDMQKNPTGAKLYAEMALIRACDSSLSTEPSALLERISAIEDKLAGGNLVIPAPVAWAEAPPPCRKIFHRHPQKPFPPKSKKEETAPSSSPEKEKSRSKQRRGFRNWPEVVKKLPATEGTIAPFLQAASAYEGSDGRFYIYFENAFAISLLTEEHKKTICAAINAAGGSYQPTDLVGAVREDAGGLREPIDDLVEMDGGTDDDAKL